MSRSKVTTTAFSCALRHELARRLVGDHPAVIDDRDPVAQLLGFLEIVGRQDDGDALGVEPADIVPQLPAKLDVDARGRLVEHQDRRRMDHRLGDQQPPLHSARQGPRIGVRLVGQVHRREQLVAFPLGRREFRTAPPGSRASRAA